MLKLDTIRKVYDYNVCYIKKILFIEIINIEQFFRQASKTCNSFPDKRK